MEQNLVCEAYVLKDKLWLLQKAEKLVGREKEMACTVF